MGKLWVPYWRLLQAALVGGSLVASLVLYYTNATGTVYYSRGGMFWPLAWVSVSTVLTVLTFWRYGAIER